MTTKRSAAADTIVEEQLDQRLKNLEDAFGGNALVFHGPLYSGIDDQIRSAAEDLRGTRKTRKQKLVFVIETTGGYIEVVERIVTTLRHHFREVVFVVPNYAMSAGTVLVLSGDAIFMDYYSVLGPIDPQIKKGGQWVPALGYLEQYEALIEKSRQNTLTTAELTFLVQKFNPAELSQYEHANQQSISLLKEWLVKYKFKNWKTTEKRGITVTRKMREDRAEEVATKLSKTDEWHSHGRGISMEVLKRKVRLEIDNFGTLGATNTAIRSYYDLLTNYMMRRGQTGVVHTYRRYVPLFSST